MKFDQTDPTHRTVVALLAAALITFAVWGVWMSVGFLIGAAGWLASKIGAGLLAVAAKMTATHMNVAWIALPGLVRVALRVMRVRHFLRIEVAQ